MEAKRQRNLYNNAATMTVFSCLAIGIAFLLAVGLLAGAGVLLGWVLPDVIERARARKDAAPPNKD